MTKSLVLAVLLLGVTTAPGWALNAQEAKAVVTILELLSPERGEGVYMGEGVAEAWFEYDLEGVHTIMAAGFSEQSWARAYDELLLGYAAGIDLAELEAQIAAAAANVAASGLGESDKAEFLADFHAQMAEVKAARLQGVVHADAVAPYWDRLHRLVQGE